MKKIKILTAMICLLALAIALPFTAFAMEAVSADLPFSVKNVSGTVVIDAVDGAPLPEQAVYENVTDGTFTVRFTKADTYHYKVYQRAGSEKTVRYDDTVYEVAVAVLSNEDGSLYIATAVNKQGDTHKLTANDIVFENIRAEGGISLHKTVTGVGDKSRDWHFTITLSEPLTGTYGDVTFQDGVGHVTLKHGESAVAGGFFSGVDYQITEEEADKDGYKTTSEGAQGKTVNGAVLRVSFVNDRSILSGILHSPLTGGYAIPIAVWSAIFAVFLVCIILIARRAAGKRKEEKE